MEKRTHPLSERVPSQSYQGIRSLRSLPERDFDTYRVVQYIRDMRGRGLYSLVDLKRSVASHFETKLRLTDTA